MLVEILNVIFFENVFYVIDLNDLYYKDLWNIFWKVL